MTGSMTGIGTTGDPGAWYSTASSSDSHQTEGKGQATYACKRTSCGQSLHSRGSRTLCQRPQSRQNKRQMMLPHFECNI